MKTKLILIVLAIFFLSTKSYCQISFGVSPGIALNSAYFGYKVNEKLIPFIGFQYANAKFKLEESGEEFDYDLGRVVSYSNETTFSGSLYVPNIGAKYFIKQQNKINAYVTLCLSKPFLSGKLKNDGEVDEDFKEEIKKISMFGGEFGFGVEYFFDENFSIGGEFGLRYLHLKYKDTFDDEFYNPNTGDYQTTEIKDDFRYNVSPTYSKIAFNFYF
jgi:opacity protein-like surface antigen